MLLDPESLYRQLGQLVAEIPLDLFGPGAISADMRSLRLLMLLTDLRQIERIAKDVHRLLRQCLEVLLRTPDPFQALRFGRGSCIHHAIISK